VLLNAGTGGGYTYQWKKNGAVITGATTSSFTASTSGIYTVLITVPGGCNAVSAPIVVTVNPSPVVIPSVSISGNPGFILCVTTRPDTFTASSGGGGFAPAYQWYVNGAAAGTGITYNYTPANGDVVKCVLTSDDACAFPVTAVATDTVLVSGMHAPSVSIAAGSSAVCTGDSVTYSAVALYGGSAPSFLWTQNGVAVATGPYYRYPPSNGDVLRCSMLSNFPCATTSAATSAPFTVSVQPVIPNDINIYVSQAGIATGTVDTFVAVAPYAGSSPVYQWRINGAPVPGATTATYITSTLINGEVISCDVTSSNPCVFPRTEISSGIVIRVWGVGVKNVTNGPTRFELIPNPNKGEFTISGTLNNAADEGVNIQVTDVLGQVVYTGATNAANGKLEAKITLGNSLANGVYLVSIINGGDHEVFHMVLEK